MKKSELVAAGFINHNKEVIIKVQTRINYLILLAAFVVAIGGFTVEKISGCRVASILLNTPGAKVELIKPIKVGKMIVLDHTASFDTPEILYNVLMETKAVPVVDVRFTKKTIPKDTTKKSGGALFWVTCSNGKNGYIDNTGKIVIQPRFDWTLSARRRRMPKHGSKTPLARPGAPGSTNPSARSTRRPWKCISISSG